MDTPTTDAVEAARLNKQISDREYVDLVIRNGKKLAAEAPDHGLEVKKR